MGLLWTELQNVSTAVIELPADFIDGLHSADRTQSPRQKSELAPLFVRCLQYSYINIAHVWHGLP